MNEDESDQMDGKIDENIMNDNDKYSLYLAFLVNKLSNFKYKVMSMLKGYDDLFDKFFPIVPCNIDGLETPMTAMKLFAPNLYREDRSIKENLETLEDFLKKNFFGKPYVIRGNTLEFEEPTIEEQDL